MSYQNGKSASGYQPIEGEDGSPRRRGYMKWAIAAVLIAVGIGGIVFWHKSQTPGAKTDAAVAKADLPKSKSGKLKLFDGTG